VHRFSVAEYHRLVEVGLLDEDARVELLEGWIVPKMSRSPLHDAVIHILLELLRNQLAAEFTVRVQAALLTDDSEPEPDLALVIGPTGRYRDHHPSTGEILLVIEVADASLARDRRKAAIYASIGVPAYWIVNLQDRCVEVRTQPEPDRRRYCVTTVHRPGELIEARSGDQMLAAIQVDDLFA
jgi:Uma2 family endonuclease